MVIPCSFVAAILAAILIRESVDSLCRDGTDTQYTGMPIQTEASKILP